LNAAGQASVTVSALQVNATGHVIQASYVPTGTFAASTAMLTQTINAATTTTALSASPPTSSFRQAGTFTATLSTVAPGAGTPTGNVQFFIDSVVAGTVALGAGGTAAFTTSTLPVGNHNISATYVPNVLNFSGSNSATIVENVGIATATVTLL